MKKVLLATAIFSGAVLALEITGAGGSFPYALYSKWASEYNKETRHKVNYQIVGSVDGIKQAINRTVDFASIVTPLTPEELEKHKLIQYPVTIGAIVVTYSVPELGKTVLNLDAKAVCDIYMGKITKWNDPYLQKLNPNVNLPDRPIVVVRRSDSSGTTWIFTSWLSKTCPEWKEKVGFGTSVKWPTGVGAKENEGVSNYVKRSRGGIGYVEYNYAKQNDLPVARIKNREGNFVEPNVRTLQEAAKNAKWDKSKHFAQDLTNQPGKDAYPIVGTTFTLVAKDQPERAKKANTFFKWAFEKGDRYAQELHYIPLPRDVKNVIYEYWREHGVAP